MSGRRNGILIAGLAAGVIIVTLAVSIAFLPSLSLPKAGAVASTTTVAMNNPNFSSSDVTSSSIVGSTSGVSSSVTPSIENSTSVTSPTSQTLTMNNSTTGNSTNFTNSTGWTGIGDIGTGGQSMMIWEHISALDPAGRIYCENNGGGTSQSFVAGTFCNQTIVGSASPSVPAADFGLLVGTNASNSSIWQFNLGVTMGNGPSNYIWNFGDGSKTISVSNQTISHEYNKSGIYAARVSLLITSPSNSSKWELNAQISISVLVGNQASPNSNQALDSQTGSSVCSDLFDGTVGTGGWNATSNTCTLTGNPIESPTFLMDSGSTLVIGKNVTLILANSGSGFANYGTIENNGTLIIQNSFSDYGAIVNHGTLINQDINFQTMSTSSGNETGTLNNTGLLENVQGAAIENGGTINNNGTIDNMNNSTIYNNLANTSVINNYGTINNRGTLQNKDVINNYGNINNQGIIVNICDGKISGNTPAGNTVTSQGCN